MENKPLSRIPKNRKSKMKNNMTEAQMMEKFINEHADIAFKYVLWQETILPNQIFNPDVNVEAVDLNGEEVQFITFNDPGDEHNNTSGNSVVNYGVIEQLPDDPTRV